MMCILEYAYLLPLEHIIQFRSIHIHVYKNYEIQFPIAILTALLMVDSGSAEMLLS